MQILIYIGVAMAVAGLAGIFWCIWLAAGIRRKGLQGQEAASALGRIAAINMGSLAIAVLGMMMAVIGGVL